MELPPEAQNVEVTPYTRKGDCCCGDPNCSEFEDRMAAWGIPLDEIITVTYELPLNRE